MKLPHTRIFLQFYGADLEDLTPEERSKPAEEITWCRDKIYDTDVAYVLESSVAFMQEQINQLNDLCRRMATTSLPAPVVVDKEIAASIRESVSIPGRWTYAPGTKTSTVCSMWSAQETTGEDDMERARRG